MPSIAQQPPTYITLKKDPTQKIERKMFEALKEPKNDGVINNPIVQNAKMSYGP